MEKLQCDFDSDLQITLEKLLTSGTKQSYEVFM